MTTCATLVVSKPDPTMITHAAEDRAYEAKMTTRMNDLWPLIKSLSCSHHEPRHHASRASFSLDRQRLLKNLKYRQSLKCGGQS